MAILPARYPLKPPIVNILGLKSDFDFFGVADYVRTKSRFFGGGGGGVENITKKILYCYPAHTLKWALQNNFTPPPLLQSAFFTLITQKPYNQYL